MGRGLGSHKQSSRLSLLDEIHDAVPHDRAPRIGVSIGVSNDFSVDAEFEPIEDYSRQFPHRIFIRAIS